MNIFQISRACGAESVMLYSCSLLWLASFASCSIVQFQNCVAEARSESAYGCCLNDSNLALRTLSQEALFELIENSRCELCAPLDKKESRAKFISMVSISYVKAQRWIRSLFRNNTRLPREVVRAFQDYLDDEIRLNGTEKIRDFEYDNPDEEQTIQRVREYLTTPSLWPSWRMVGPVVYEGRSVLEATSVSETPTIKLEVLLGAVLEFYAGKVSESQNRTIIPRTLSIIHYDMASGQFKVFGLTIEPGMLLCEIDETPIGSRLFCIDYETPGQRPKLLAFENQASLDNARGANLVNRIVSATRNVSEYFQETDIQIIPAPVPICEGSREQGGQSQEHLVCLNHSKTAALWVMKHHIMGHVFPSGEIDWYREVELMAAELLTGRMIGVDAPRIPIHRMTMRSKLVPVIIFIFVLVAFLAIELMRYNNKAGEVN